MIKWLKIGILPVVKDIMLTGITAAAIILKA